MKISVVTVTMNDSPESLRRNIMALERQTYPCHEHIIVDSGIDRGMRSDVAGGRCIYCRCSPGGVYNAINYGMSKAHGDVIGLIHGNDCLGRDDALESVARVFTEREDVGFVYSDVDFYKYGSDGSARMVRHYGASRFEPTMLTRGFAPPHPSLFIRREVAIAVGPYAEDYKVGADFEMWLRLFDPDRGLGYSYLPGTLVRMSSGGMSTKLSNVLSVNIKEKIKALRSHGFEASLFRLLTRYFYLINPK